MKEFEGKVAIVTRTTGIGRAIVERFAAGGADVLACGIKVAADKELALEAKESGLSLRADPCDVTQADAVRAAVAKAVKEIGGLDIIVNAAAFHPFDTVVETDLETWNRYLLVNVGSIYLVGHYGVPEMKKRGGGANINLASVQGHACQREVAAYAASKGAVHSFIRALALDHAPDNIRVNSISPGSIRTPVLERSAGNFAPACRSQRCFNVGATLIRWGALGRRRKWQNWQRSWSRTKRHSAPAAITWWTAAACWRAVGYSDFSCHCTATGLCRAHGRPLRRRCGLTCRPFRSLLDRHQPLPDSSLHLSGSVCSNLVFRGAVRYTHSVLRSSMRPAIRWRLLLEDPTYYAQLPRYRRREMRVLTAKQPRAFLEAVLKTHYGRLRGCTDFCSAPQRVPGIEAAGHQLEARHRQRRANTQQRKWRLAFSKQSEAQPARDPNYRGGCWSLEVSSHQNYLENRMQLDSVRPRLPRDSSRLEGCKFRIVSMSDDHLMVGILGSAGGAKC
jgi:meso-butanediol dehydrogenase / (S,S)-butanediol dehydrogenase / diacetyl reductase